MDHSWFVSPLPASILQQQVVLSSYKTTEATSAYPRVCSPAAAGTFDYLSP